MENRSSGNKGKKSEHFLIWQTEFLYLNNLFFADTYSRYLLNRYYKLSVLVMCFIIPTIVPWYLWGESLWVAYFVPTLLRYTLVLNATWLVNSAAHMWGNRPYDKNINPRENKFVTFSAIGMNNTPTHAHGRNYTPECTAQDSECLYRDIFKYFLSKIEEEKPDFYCKFVTSV